MKYKFSQPLVEGLVKSRPNRFIMFVDVGGKTHRCHCPSTGRICSIEFEDIPCLLSKATGTGRTTDYTVEAISLDLPGRKRKKWIGINQTRANSYIEFFLRQGLLSKMFGKVGELKREVKVGNSRIDFVVNGNKLLEVKTPLIYVPCEGHPKYVPRKPVNIQTDRLIKHFKEVSKNLGPKSKSIFVVCFMYDAEPFDPPMLDEGSKKINAVAKAANRKGVENWQVNLRIDGNGVELLDYFKLNLFGDS